MAGEQEPSAFVLMPFGSPFDNAYKDLIRPALEAAGYKVTRADSPLDQRNILKDIVLGIAKAHLVVADVTGLNPNVLYEVGMAHGLLKPTILLTQAIDELPFDLRPYRVVPYGLRYDQAPLLTQQLKAIAEGHLRGVLAFENPVSDFAPELVSQATAKTLGYPQEAGGGLTPALFEEAGAAFDEVARYWEQLHRIYLQDREKRAVPMQRLILLAEHARPGDPGVRPLAQEIARELGEASAEFNQALGELLPKVRAAWLRWSAAFDKVAWTARISSDSDRSYLETTLAQLEELSAKVNAQHDKEIEYRSSLFAHFLVPEFAEWNRAEIEASGNNLEMLVTEASALARMISLIKEKLGRVSSPAS